MRSSHHREIIGLDIGKHSAKAIRATHSYRGLRIHESERVRMPANDEQRREVLRALVEEKDWKGLPCVVSAPDDAVVLQTLSVPQASARAMRDEVMREIRKLQEMSPGQTTHTWVRQGKDYRFVLLAAARLDSVMMVFELAAATGLEVIDVVSGTAAMHRAVTSTTSMKRVGFPICIDIGHEGCNVAIGPRGRIEFARHLTSGYAAMHDASGDDHAGDGLGSTSMSACIDELKYTLALHASRLEPGAQQPNRVILCGGGARDASLCAAIEKAIGLETLCFGSLGPSGSLSEADVFATAIGLARVGLENGRSRPSVLPLAMQERLSIRGQMKYWYATAVAVVCASAVLTFGVELKLRTGEAHLALLEVRLAEQTLLQKNLALVRRLNRDLETQIYPFRIAVHNGTMIRAVIDAISATKHADDWFVLLADADTYGMPGAETATADFRAPVARLIIEGCTPDPDLGTVRAMIDQLRERPGIVSADLLSDDLLRQDAERDARWKPTGARMFAIEIAMPGP